MAEGWLRALGGDRFEALSAGSKPAGYVHPRAVAAMAEVGVDIAGQSSKSINDFLPPLGTPPDLIISVCSGAEKECPLFPGAVLRWHWPFDDPYHCQGDETQIASEFRRVRDEIHAAIVKGLIENATW